MTKLPITLLAMAGALAITQSAVANTIDINWVKNGINKLNGSTTWTNGAQVSATSWTQVGLAGAPTFDLTLTGTAWNQNQGEASNHSGGAGQLGLPSLDSKASGATETITVKESGGGLFDFDSIDMKNSGSAKETYTIQGYTGTPGDYTLAYTLTCGHLSEGQSACPTTSTYSTVSGGTDSSDQVTELKITVVPTSSYEYLDYLDLTPVPEPSSLLLLGTGLLGLALVAFRKDKASGSVLNM